MLCKVQSCSRGNVLAWRCPESFVNTDIDWASWGEPRPVPSPLNRETLGMIKSDNKKKLEFCQSKYYKSWNPDYLSEYSRLLVKISQYHQLLSFFSSLKDKHLKCYFNKPKAKKQLLQNQQVIWRSSDRAESFLTPLYPSDHGGREDCDREGLEEETPGDGEEGEGAPGGLQEEEEKRRRIETQQVTTYVCPPVP